MTVTHGKRFSETGVLERRPAGAFGYANRDAERYAVARSNTTGVYNSHYRGLRFRSTPGYFLEARMRFSATAMAYLNRIARLVRPLQNNINQLY